MRPVPLRRVARLLLGLTLFAIPLIAQNMANALDNSNASTAGNPNGYHNGYTAQGFSAADFAGSDADVQVFDCSDHGGCDSGNAPADRINMPSTGYKTSSEACIRLVIGHELFHHVQYAYITFGKWSTWGATPVEGTARMMQDKMYTDLDGGAGCITYGSEANGYLGNPNRNMWNLSYTSALFWQYMAEQLGTTPGEPVFGVDFIREFWENAQANNDSPDLIGTVRQTISQFQPGRTLEDVFHDFTIANYAKSLNTAALPNASRYDYRDESDGTGWTYGAVAKAWTGNIPPTKGPTADSVVEWGAKYYEATPSADCRVIGFQSTGDTAAYGLIASTGSNNAQRLFKSVTTDFKRAYINRAAQPYTKLGVSVAGLSNPANFTYKFACGGARLQIVRPSTTYKAYVGEPAEPDQFLAIVNVFGPEELGEPSVEGLDVSDFQAWVGDEQPANVATVLAGSYVQGSYWLVLQAPEKATDGVYPLLIKLGDLAADTKNGVVQYSKMQRNQEIVIDASGSMSAPAGNTKMDAAKNAGRLFVDAAPSSDKLGVVWFSGNGSEPNDDAFVVHTLQDVAGQRTNAKTAISGLSPQNLTSIGDGLKKGQAELDAWGDPLGQDYIVLLSDGLENESDFWSTVKPSITAAGTTVFSIALGPETDQALMQEIASTTGGDYLYVDLGGASGAGASVAAAPGAAPMAAAALSNRLADAFRTTMEGIRRHERLWEQVGTLAAGATVDLNIPIDEQNLVDPVFTANWAKAANVKVQLFRPDNSEVLSGPGAEVFADNTHATFQLEKIDQTGVWRLRLTNSSGDALEFAAAFSAKNAQGAKLRLYFGQNITDPSAESLNRQFLRGVPMPVLATLTDRKGPVRGAKVLAQIEHPDGSTDELALLDDGSHGDGGPDDGVYGNVYTRTDRGSTNGVDDRDTTTLPVRGSYLVVARAEGESNFGDPFTRIRRGAFQLYEFLRDVKPIDGDQDGMPDRYEVLHGCLSAQINDAKVDADGDGLASLKEYELGTDPCDMDTDNGGEHDGSEVNRGANPFDARDDKAVKIIDAEVLTGPFDHLPDPPVKPNMNTIRYPVLQACALLRLERREGNDPFKVIAEFAPAQFGGLYFDEGLANDTLYIYRLTCVGGNGEEAEPSNEFAGIPREDPIPPAGRVIVADDRPVVTTVAVKVRLVSDEDAKEMLVSNGSDFAGANWQPFQEVISWQLAPVAGRATVFARFRDAAGNESETYQDEVLVRGAATVGLIRGTVTLKRGVIGAAAETSAGVFVGVAGQSDIPPVFTDANGAFALPDLPPGEYRLRFELTGFAAQEQTVTVTEGGVTDVGEVTLSESAKTFLPVMMR